MNFDQQPKLSVIQKNEIPNDSDEDYLDSIVDDMDNSDFSI